jgi:glycine/D-amino acid oxidase-like deaminating enzyme
MQRNLSPWIYELSRQHIPRTLSEVKTHDVCIVGGGIAGVTTAYTLLTSTNLNISLVEGDLVGSGATGHNAGQVVDYFEKPYYEIVDDFGLDMATAAQRAISAAWQTLRGICEEAHLKVPFHECDGVAGIRSTAAMRQHIHNYALRARGGIHILPILVTENIYQSCALQTLPPGLVQIVPETHIRDLLQTDDKRYFAVMQERKGTLNSALFVEELVSHMLLRFGDRFALYERSPITTIELQSPYSRLTSLQGAVMSRVVVLCTNGFEQLTLSGTHGVSLNGKLHDQIYGIVGYMAALIEREPFGPAAISYIGEERSYMYMTRRSFHFEGSPVQLLCVGGPETIYTHDMIYIPDADYPDDARRQITQFLRETYRYYDPQLPLTFCWHGLMGYTKTGVRIVGREPLFPQLYYNLGCNGVGILPSIMGATKIAAQLSGARVESDIFDPHP